MRIQHKILLSTSMALSLATTSVANAGCALDAVTLNAERSIQLGGQWVDAKLITQFSFSNLPSGKVRIDQNVTIVTPTQAVLDATKKKLQKLPDDECGQLATYDGVTLKVEPPSLKLQVDFSAAQWACTSMDVPCPTTGDPLRWCTQEAKTRLGSGNGWVKVFLTPTLNQQALEFTQQDQKHFAIDDETKWIGVLLGTITAGSAGLAAVTLLGDYLESLVKNYIRVSPMSASEQVEEIPGFPAKTDYAGFTREIVEKECFRIGVMPTLDGVELGLGVATEEMCIDHSAVELQVQRSGNVKAPMACFIRSVLLSRARF